MLILERISIYVKFPFASRVHIVFQATCIKVLNLSGSKLRTCCLCTFEDNVPLPEAWLFSMVLSEVIYDSQRLLARTQRGLWKRSVALPCNLRPILLSILVPGGLRQFGGQTSGFV